MAKRNTPSGLTTANLFQIMTGCGLFFACMQASPTAAICLTLLTTPAIIRTGLISQRHRQSGIKFGFRCRLKFFAQSVAVVLSTCLLAGLTFVIVSVGFGLVCVLISSVATSSTGLIRDIAFIGVLGGSIWGLAAAVMSLSWTHRMWQIPTE